MRKSRINSKRTVIGGLVLAAACAAAVPATAAHASTRADTGPGHSVRPQDGTTDGCDIGDVCMYNSKPGPGSTPEQAWTAYGCHNLSGEDGPRWVLNNQYGGATAMLWGGSNCTGSSTPPILAGQIWNGNITPINSISLQQ